MTGPAELFWRLFPDIRSHERSRLLFFGGLAALTTLAQTLGLVGSEALFLSRFGAERLPETFIAAALVSALGSFAYARRVGEVRNDGLFARMAVGAALLLVAATAATAAGQAWTIPVLFCFYHLTQVVFLNHFLTFAGDYFDTITSKRMFPRFAIGSSLGGALGGVLAALVVDLVHPLHLVTAWAVVLAATALMLRMGRRRLRRWGPLELEESDQTSVEGMRGALRYLRSSSLGRPLLLSALGMVIALFVAQYLYSDIFARRFPDAGQLATFFGIYLAATNVIEIGIGFAVTPWLIRRWGVPSANLIHPVLTVLSFGALGLQYGLTAGVAARMNREMVDNAIALPVRALVLNALPFRFRGRVRAFLEGTIVYAGMAGAGAVLLALGKPAPVWLCLAGGAAAFVFLAANLRARREYLHTLVGELRAGRLDLDAVGDEIGNWGASRLAELWEQLLAEEGARPSRSLLELIPTLVARGITAPLVRAASHPNADIRRSCVNALATTLGHDSEGTLALALDDTDASVRLAALRGLSRVEAPPSFLIPRLQKLVRDASPAVRAEASLLCGEEGSGILRGMIDSGTAAEAEAALRVAPPALLDAALKRVRDGDLAIRAAALECAARIAPEPPLPSAELVGLLDDPDTRVRRVAVLLLATFHQTDGPSMLTHALADPSPEVRFTAESALRSMHEQGVAAAEQVLRSDCERAVEGALRVVAASEQSRSRSLLERELRHRARELWYHMVSLQCAPSGAGVASLFLRAAFRDALVRSHRLAFRTLELIEDRAVIRKVEKVLRFGSTRSRGDALAVLSSLGDPVSAQLLVLIHEAGPLEERSRAASWLIPLPTQAEEVLDAARCSELRWIRIAVQAIDARERGDVPVREEEESMERLLALKQVSLFAHLSLEQLEAVYRTAREVEYFPNEVIVREGDPGGELFLLIEGSVRVLKRYGTASERELRTLSAVSYFGEMAILDDEPRSATVVAAEPTRLLSLDGNSLKELILQMPEICFEIFRVLTHRVRAAEGRLADR
jgi:hypothetical protein